MTDDGNFADYAIVMGLIVVCSALCFFAGRVHEERRWQREAVREERLWQKEAVQHGVAEYRVDPETGVVEFVWIVGEELEDE